MDKINVLQFEDGRIGLATEGITMTVNKQEPVNISEIEVEDMETALQDPSQFKEENNG